MEKDRGTKVIAIIALVVAVVGVSVGFAAFTNSLTITPEAEVTPLNTLKVLFSSSNSAQNPAIGESASEVIDGSLSETFSGFSATSASIDNTNVTAPTLANLKATFVKPGETVTYTLYVHNDSTYDASLTSIAFGNKQCVAKTGTDENLVQAACDEIDVTVKVGGESGEPSVAERSQSDSNLAVSGHTLSAGAYETLVVILSYNQESGGNTDLNGGFDVIFGDITLSYTSAVSGS